MSTRISVVGLGKLGAPLAAVLAHKGYTVTGIDVNREFVDALNAGRPPVDEPGLPELIAANRERLRATTEYERAILDTDLTFVIVPTPSDDTGTFSLKYVERAMDSIGQALRKKSSFHVVSLTSTVMPGSTGGRVLPQLEQASGKRCGTDFGLCYNPEFIALGSVIRDMLRPDFILIGESDPRTGELLGKHYETIADNDPPVARMSFVNAELTKLAVNTFVTTKISYANMLAQVCEKLPGADVDVVTQALGMDTRIGKKYLRGALGYGGPCFPRDNVAFSAMARSLGAQPLLAEATDAVNRLQVTRLAELVAARLPRDGRVAVLGLSYKPETCVVEESQGLQLAQLLARKGIAVTVFDPRAQQTARALLGTSVTYADSAAAAVAQAQVVVLTTPWPEFASLPPAALDQKLGRPAVIDCWRILPRPAFAAVSDYVTLGAGTPLQN